MSLKLNRHRPSEANALEIRQALQKILAWLNDLERRVDELEVPIGWGKMTPPDFYEDIPYSEDGEPIGTEQGASLNVHNDTEDINGIESQWGGAFGIEDGVSGVQIGSTDEAEIQETAQALSEETGMPTPFLEGLLEGVD